MVLCEVETGFAVVDFMQQAVVFQMQRLRTRSVLGLKV